MKKFIAIIALSFITFDSSAQVPKIPLIEHFTQASCGPCAQQNPPMYSILNSYGAANYNKVTYQVSWPGFDPMNLEYPSGPEDRRNYYGVEGVPNANINGGPVNQPASSITNAKLNAAAALTTPYQINIIQTWGNGAELTVDITITNTTATEISGANKLHLVMIENHIQFSSAPGSNGEKDFYSVARDMINASTGASTTSGLTIAQHPPGLNEARSPDALGSRGLTHRANLPPWVAFWPASGSRSVPVFSPVTPNGEGR